MALPDLIATITPQLTIVDFGEYFTFKSFLKNIGDISATSNEWLTVSFYVDDRNYGGMVYTNDGIYSYKSKMLSYVSHDKPIELTSFYNKISIDTIPLNSGQHYLKMIVNENGIIPEIRYDNNTSNAISFIIKYPSDNNIATNENDKLLGTGKADNISGLAGDDDIYGLTGADKLNGNQGNDNLHGGTGRNILTGGTGNDNFIFDAFMDGASDKITDFSAMEDKIVLDHFIFESLDHSGKFNSDELRIGSGIHTALDNDDYVMYNTDNGKLYYDYDANGFQPPIQLAILVNHPMLTVDNFMVI